MMTSTLDIKDWVYSKKATVEKSGELSDFVEDYAQLIVREGGKTKISGAVVINIERYVMKAISRPASMDFALAVGHRTLINRQNMFMLVDCKFRTRENNNVCTNISDADIKDKFYGSKQYISMNCSLPCCDTALFLFKDKNFEQVRRAWGRRTLNNPQNKAIKMSEFKTLFTP